MSSPEREAPPDLRVLARWEELASWLLAHSGKWPRSVRFHLAQRVADLSLAVLELLIEARYETATRTATLRAANLCLERLRFLLRIAQRLGVSTGKPFERAMREIDACGRMIGAWRNALPPTPAPRA